MVSVIASLMFVVILVILVKLAIMLWKTGIILDVKVKRKMKISISAE